MRPLYLAFLTSVLVFFGLSFLYSTIEKAKKERSSQRMSVLMNYRDLASRGFETWIASAESKLSKAQWKIASKKYVTMLIVLSAVFFVLGMALFKNLTASIFLAATMFIFPEQILHVMITKRNEKISFQLAAAIRIFAAEFVHNPQLEKCFAVVAKRIKRPVGTIFSRARKKLLMGLPKEKVLSEMLAEMDSEYGKMFVQLLLQSQRDTSTAALFSDLAMKVEAQRELQRKNISQLAGERTLSYIMVLAPIPIYLFMKTTVPETQEFLVHTFTGRLAVTGVFFSIFVWCLIDRMLGGVEA